MTPPWYGRMVIWGKKGDSRITWPVKMKQWKKFDLDPEKERALGMWKKGNIDYKSDNYTEWRKKWWEFLDGTVERQSRTLKTIWNIHFPEM